MPDSSGMYPRPDSNRLWPSADHNREQPVIGLAHGATATGELAAQVAQTRGLYGQLHELGASTPSVNIAGADGRLRVLADQTDDLVQAGLCKWIDGAPSAGTTPSAKEAEPPPPEARREARRGGRRMLKATRARSRVDGSDALVLRLTAFLSFLA